MLRYVFASHTGGSAGERLGSRKNRQSSQTAGSARGVRKTGE